MAGGAGWAGAPAALLRSVRRLREVFEVCGRDPDGFLRVERVAALGMRFGQGEEVEKLVKYLDPNDLGRINFKDFCRGVFAMKGCEELLKDVLSVESAGTLPCAPEIPDCVEQDKYLEMLPTTPVSGKIKRDQKHHPLHGALDHVHQVPPSGGPGRPNAGGSNLAARAREGPGELHLRRRPLGPGEGGVGRACLAAARPITGVAPATCPYLRGRGYLDPAPRGSGSQAALPSPLVPPPARGPAPFEPGARAPRDVTAALIQRTLRPTRVSRQRARVGAGPAPSTGAEPGTQSRRAPGCSLRSAGRFPVRPTDPLPPVSLLSAAHRPARGRTGMRTPPATGGQGCEVPDPTFADGELLPTEPDFFPEDEDEAMTLAPPEGPQESDMEGPVESTRSLEGPVGIPAEKDAGLGGLFLPEDKSLGHPPSMTTSDLSTHSTTSLISNEEQFEDYGEADDVDCAPSSPCPDDETRTNVYSDLGSSVSSSAGQTPRKMRHAYNSELLDVYCSQCCKKINLLNDLEARLKNLKANSPNRKISSTAFGRQLMHSSNFSSSNGSTEDLFRDSIDSCDNDITEKVSFLEKKVTELENDSLTNGDLKSKLKQENTQLVHRVHELEEMVKDQETTAEQALEEEARRHREAYSKLERERGTEIELLTTRVQQLEEENTELRTTVTRLKSQTEKLDEERQRMSDRLEDTSLRLKDEMDLYKRMMDKLRHNRLEFQKEREATQELIEDLRKELEHLQMYKLDCERPGRGRSSSSSLGEFNARAREVELEHEVKRLKQENHKLRDQNDDLNGQILSLSLYEAKNLFATQTKAQSLAAEIDTASRDELMEALKEQEEINFRLRQYMDKIILAILDHNPSILEIKH